MHDQARPLTCSGASVGRCEPDGVYLMQDIKGSSHVHNNIAPPDRHVSVHGLLHALYDRLAGARRRGPGSHVGP